jgi:hypothetical protein
MNTLSTETITGIQGGMMKGDGGAGSGSSSGTGYTSIVSYSSKCEVQVIIQI